MFPAPKDVIDHRVYDSSIKTSTYRIMFMGTPHQRGSEPFGTKGTFRKKFFFFFGCRKRGLNLVFKFKMIDIYY